MQVAARGQVYADTVGASYGDAGVRDFAPQPRTVLDRTTLGVSALDSEVLQELVEQIAMAPLTSTPSKVAIRAYSAQRRRPQPRWQSHWFPARSGRSSLTWPAVAMALAATGNLPSWKIGSEIRPHMQQLQEDASSGGVYRIGGLPPACQLLVGSNSRRVGVAETSKRGPHQGYQKLACD